MTELAAICCCESAPGVCTCTGCPSSYLVQVDVDVQYQGMGTTCPSPFAQWDAEDVMTKTAGCNWFANTPLGTLAYQSPNNSCGAGQVANYNGTLVLSPSFVNLECGVSSSVLVPPPVQALLSTPTCWRMRLQIFQVGFGQHWFINAWYDRPEACPPQDPPVCLECVVDIGLVQHAAYIAGSVGSAAFGSIPGATVSVDTWNVSIT